MRILHAFSVLVACVVSLVQIPALAMPINMPTGQRWQPNWPKSVLERTAWRVISFDGKELKGRHASIFFVRNGMEMFSPCAFFESWAKIDGNRIQLMSDSSRYRGCPSINTEQTIELLKLMHQIRTFQHVPGERLVLITSNGKRIVTESREFPDSSTRVDPTLERRP